MRVTYLRLENVAGLMVGSDRTELEISFEGSKNPIISIQGRNGIGKTVLLSSIHPFAHVSSLDERSTLPYIKRGKNGYKEIHYQDGEDSYILKHYFKASKETHVVKSYFLRNGEELNESGNVTSFQALVEQYFSLTPEMMRLVRIGTNVNSFVSLSPAKRKEYIGKLIEDLNIFLTIHKKVNEDLRVVKALLQVNRTNQYNCHITDYMAEMEELQEMERLIKKKTKERDQMIRQIAHWDSILKAKDLDEMLHRSHELEGLIHNGDRIEEQCTSLGDLTMDQLIEQRNLVSAQLLEEKSQINSIRLVLDQTMSRLEKLAVTIQQISSDHDLVALLDHTKNLQMAIRGIPDVIKSFKPGYCRYDLMQSTISKLTSYNQVSQMILTLGNKPLDLYLELLTKEQDIEAWLQEQSRRMQHSYQQSDLKRLLDQLFQEDTIIEPNCVDAFLQCPYYRLAHTVTDLYQDLNQIELDGETLRYIQTIHRNVMMVWDGLYAMQDVPMPDRLQGQLEHDVILNRLRNHLPFFDLSGFMEFATLLREYECYQDQLAQLKQCEAQIAIYQKAGVGSQLKEKEELERQIQSLKEQLQARQRSYQQIASQMEEVDRKIGLITKRDDARKFRDLYQKELQRIQKSLKPLEEAKESKQGMNLQLQHLTQDLESMRANHQHFSQRLKEYEKLVQEQAKLEETHRDLNSIATSVGTKKGIPVIYMRRYLQQIQDITNDLLNLIYQGEFKLAPFYVTADSFEIPYQKGRFVMPDIRYASQSEVALATMALSFALSNQASKRYNVILLDEIDAGLDEENRNAFLRMLRRQMELLHAEQVFIISHNLSQMINVPMDAIRLSDSNIRSKLQNVIYE